MDSSLHPHTFYSPRPTFVRPIPDNVLISYLLLRKIGLSASSIPPEHPLVKHHLSPLQGHLVLPHTCLVLLLVISNLPDLH